MGDYTDSHADIKIEIVDNLDKTCEVCVIRTVVNVFRLFEMILFTCIEFYDSFDGSLANRTECGIFICAHAAIECRTIDTFS